MIKYKNTITCNGDEYGIIKTIALSNNCTPYFTTNKGIFKYLNDKFIKVSDLNDVNCLAIKENGGLVLASESIGLNIYDDEDTTEEPLFSHPEFRGVFCYLPLLIIF